MPAGVVFILVVFTTASTVSLTVFTLLKLHREGIVEVRIPKPLRIGVFEGYLSPEEKAAINADQERLKKLEIQKELMARMAAKPAVDGYKIEDSLFRYEDQDDEPVESKDHEDNTSNLNES